MNSQAQRLHMVSHQIQQRGISDQQIVQAMQTIPRHKFVPTAYEKYAYEDKPIAIGLDQTISQPYMVALMTQLLQLKPDNSVLEIGTGSGYQTAILAELSDHTVTIERHQSLSTQACKQINQLGYTNIEFRVGDGTLGAPDKSPFDSILVTAAGPSIPEKLLSQLNVGGRMVCPVGKRDVQELLVIQRNKNGITSHKHSKCKFVPLIGKEGWTQ